MIGTTVCHWHIHISLSGFTVKGFYCKTQIKAFHKAGDTFSALSPNRKDVSVMSFSKENTSFVFQFGSLKLHKSEQMKHP